MTLKIKSISNSKVHIFNLICDWEKQVKPVSHYQQHHFYTKLLKHSRACHEVQRIFVLIFILGATPANLRNREIRGIIVLLWHIKPMLVKGG